LNALYRAPLFPAFTCERSIVTMDAKIETTGNEQMEHEQRARTADFIERARVKQKSSRPS
jgi:hypothetical protein